MSIAPVPNELETRDNACFEALLWSLSRPGQIRSLPTAGEAAIVDALIDRECRVYASDDEILARAKAAGAELVDLEKACHAFVGSMDNADQLRSVRIGSDTYPDDGATVVIQVKLGEGDKLRFTGPGIDGALSLSIGGLPTGFWQMRKDCLRYPMGFDLLLVDADKVVGIPRSTDIEVL